MKDEEQIKDYKIDSKKFIVVMKKKEKVEAAPSTAATETSTTTKPTTDSSTKKADEKIPEPAVSTTTTAAAASASGTSGAASSSAENEDVIRNMMELGYPRRLVEAALRLSYNNPDVACEYLISERITEANMDSVEADNLALGGVRDELMDLAEAFDNSRSQAAANPENEPLAFLRSQPQFHQMRSQIQENPQFLNTVLQQIGVNNPGLLKLISENQTAFVNMINEPLNNNNNSTSSNRNTSAAATAAATGATVQPAVAAAPERMEQQDQSAGEMDLTANDDLLAATLASQIGDEDDEEEEEQQQPQPGAGGQQHPQATVGGQQAITVELPELTDGDRAAILRIREISGASEIEVIQAYIACGNNEELALNFLFTD